MKATEAIEELERYVNEFGDGSIKLPDPMEAQFWYDVDRIERDPESNAYRLVSDH